MEQEGYFEKIDEEEIELVEQEEYFIEILEIQEEQVELPDEDRKTRIKDEIRQLLERIESAEKSVNKFHVFNGNLVLPTRFTLLPTYEVVR